jgi:hypothetical protein
MVQPEGAYAGRRISAYSTHRAGGSDVLRPTIDANVVGSTAARLQDDSDIAGGTHYPNLQ